MEMQNNLQELVYLFHSMFLISKQFNLLNSYIFQLILQLIYHFLFIFQFQKFQI